jgi:hypothetical protein
VTIRCHSPGDQVKRVRGSGCRASEGYSTITAVGTRIGPNVSNPNLVCELSYIGHTCDTDDDQLSAAAVVALGGEMDFENLGRYRLDSGSRSDSSMQLGIPPPKTPSGRAYRLSPNEQAYPRHFVMGNVNTEVIVTETSRKRMKIDPRSNRTVCPYSGIVADDRDFMHPADTDAALEIVKHAAIADVKEHLGRMFDEAFRSQPSGGLVRVELKANSTPEPAPQFLREDLLREIECDHCGRDYGVFAIGLFCPDCGAPNVRVHFAREVELVSKQVEVANAYAESHRELAYRLLGNAQEDVLTAFEATLKTIYLYGMSQRGPDAPAVKPPKNDFQNVSASRRRFEALNIDPFDCLDSERLALLEINIQIRHIIGHNLGVMDEQFATKANEARLGETIQLVGEDILAFSVICRCVVGRLDRWVGEARASASGA